MSNMNQKRKALVCTSYIFFTYLYLIVPASPIEHAPLEAVYIMFDTASYDEIERDEKVTETS